MNNLVEISKNKQAVTTSIRVAEVFGKRHDNVMKSVNRLIGELRAQEDFTHLKNEVSRYMVGEYTDSTGRKLKQYIMNRDGFTLLAMGFTGKKALEFKIKYINAFNEMEAKLRAMYPCGETAVRGDASSRHVVPQGMTDGKEVAVKEHTRSLPSGKKEIVLSEKAKTEIGGIVKAVVKAELEQGQCLNLNVNLSENAESWEVSDSDFLQVLYDWHATRTKADLEKRRLLMQENEQLKRRLSAIKQAVS